MPPSDLTTPRFRIPLRDQGDQVFGVNASCVGLEIVPGKRYVARLTIDQPTPFTIEVYGNDLGDVEANLVTATEVCGDIATAALMQLATEARHAA